MKIEHWKLICVTLAVYQHLTCFAEHPNFNNNNNNGPSKQRNFNGHNLQSNFNNDNQQSNFNNHNQQSNFNNHNQQSNFNNQNQQDFDFNNNWPRNNQKENNRLNFNDDLNADGNEFNANGNGQNRNFHENSNSNNANKQNQNGRNNNWRNRNLNNNNRNQRNFRNNFNRNRFNGHNGLNGRGKINRFAHRTPGIFNNINRNNHKANNFLNSHTNNGGQNQPWNNFNGKNQNWNKQNNGWNNNGFDNGHTNNGNQPTILSHQNKFFKKYKNASTFRGKYRDQQQEDLRINEVDEIYPSFYEGNNPLKFHKEVNYEEQLPRKHNPNLIGPRYRLDGLGLRVVQIPTEKHDSYIWTDGDILQFGDGVPESASISSKRHNGNYEVVERNWRDDEEHYDYDGSDHHMQSSNEQPILRRWQANRKNFQHHDDEDYGDEPNGMHDHQHDSHADHGDGEKYIHPSHGNNHISDGDDDNYNGDYPREGRGFENHEDEMMPWGESGPSDDDDDIESRDYPMHEMMRFYHKHGLYGLTVWDKHSDPDAGFKGVRVVRPKRPPPHKMRRGRKGRCA